ncbi:MULTISPECIES: hypothetical protein [Sporomusaceae]|uniref:hypothetical protein n=1 Tax=Sporomusaceae TaxID=1843490 RepID=UPI0003A14578|nr:MULTISPECIES: hypothetical protein [Sporomusaceae]
MEELRCLCCKKLLGRGLVRCVEFKCSRCGCVQVFCEKPPEKAAGEIVQCGEGMCAWKVAGK